MKLNNLHLAKNEKKTAKRVGRGIGSSLGKTAGRGHKGQKSRSGGYHRSGFEGGQMPIQRRLPKVGFVSPKNNFSVEVRLVNLSKLTGDIDMAKLKKLNIIPNWAKKAKVILSGELKQSINLVGLSVSAGAKKKIEEMGGTVKEIQSNKIEQ